MVQVLRHHGVKVAIINPAYINSSMTAVRTDVRVRRLCRTVGKRTLSGWNP